MHNELKPTQTTEAFDFINESRQPAEALDALNSLTQDQEDKITIPPIPDEIRDQWDDRYKESPLPNKPKAKPSLQKKFNRPFFWGALAFSALMIAVVVHHISQSTTDPISPPIAMRGNDEFTPQKDSFIVYIHSETIPYASFAATRQEGTTLPADNLNDALVVLKERDLESAIIIDGTKGTITPWNGNLLDDILLFENNDSFDEYDLSDHLDRFLNQSK